MSQYLPEDLSVQLDHDAAYDAAEVQANISADRVTQDAITSDVQQANRQTAASFLGRDVDEYRSTAPQPPPTAIERYLELGVDQNPSDALNAQSAQAAATAAQSSAAQTAAAQNASAFANAAPPVAQLPAETEDQARSDALRATLLYQNGSFYNGAVGGIGNSAAAASQKAANSADVGPAEDPVVEAVDAVDDVAPVDREGGRQKESADAIDTFTDHLHRRPK